MSKAITTVQELQELIGSLLQVELYTQDYCPNGLQVQGRSELQKLAFAVSADLATITAAAAWGADALIVHHGLFWDYQRGITLTGPLGARVATLMRAQMNLLAYHLPLDGHLEIGNSAQIANKLSLIQQSGFGLVGRTPVGVQGVLPAPQPLPQLIARLETLFAHPIVAAIAPAHHQTPIQKIAIVTGGGNSFLKEAAHAGHDILLTGEMKEHDWFEAQELGITLLACGHHATEQFGIQALRTICQQHFHGPTQFFATSNPA